MINLTLGQSLKTITSFKLFIFVVQMTIGNETFTVLRTKQAPIEDRFACFWFLISSLIYCPYPVIALGYFTLINITKDTVKYIYPRVTKNYQQTHYDNKVPWKLAYYNKHKDL